MVGVGKTDKNQNRISRFFHFLTLNEIASRIFGAIWDHGIEKKDQIRTVLAYAYESVSKALNIARGITFLCKTLGIGCILWLYEDLTDNL